MLIQFYGTGMSGRFKQDGSLMEPSFCCPFSIRAIKVLETAIAVPFSIWTNLFLPVSESLKRMFIRLDW